MKTIHWLSALMALSSFTNFVDAEIIIPPPDLEPGDQYRIMFASSERIAPESSIRGPFDEFIQSLVDESPLREIDGEWIAAIQTRTEGSIRLHLEDPDVIAPIYRPDGQRIVDSLGQLLSSIGNAVQSDLDIDESGNDLEGASAWTGFQVGSTRGITPGGQSTFGVIVADDTTLLLRAGIAKPTFELGHIYGISSVLTVPVPEPRYPAFFCFVAILLRFRRCRTK